LAKYHPFVKPEKKALIRKNVSSDFILNIVILAVLVIASFPKMAFTASGCLDILSDPEGVDIYVDDRHEGKTPITCLGVPAGKVTIQAKKEGYDTVSKTITVRLDDITTIKIPMKPTRKTMGKVQEREAIDRHVGSLVVFNLLGQAEIYIDGEKKGQGSLAVMDIATGTYDLRVGSFSKQIRISKDHKLKAKVNKNGIIVLNARKKEGRKPASERDGRFIRYPNGVVKDTKTGLEWVAGPDRNMTSFQAKEWVQSLSIASGSWRMPTRDELRGLYQKGKGERNMTPLLKTTGWLVWSRERNGSPSSLYFDFDFSPRLWKSRHSNYSRAFAVRSR
jgi:hypothetical protein